MAGKLIFPPSNHNKGGSSTQIDGGFLGSDKDPVLMMFTNFSDPPFLSILKVSFPGLFDIVIRVIRIPNNSSEFFEIWDHEK